MSASPMQRQAIVIPSKRVLLTDASQLPDLYSSTPNGTLYSTTPGGTRIIYDRSFLLNLRNSPMSNTPPKHLPSGLLKGSPHSLIKTNKTIHSRSPPKTIESEDQFDMDI